MKLSKPQRFALIAGGVCFLVLIGLIWQAQTPSEKSPLDEARLIQDVGTLVVLPKDETPVIAEVTDEHALASMPFFQDAKVGDVVLIYHRAKKAILYDPVKKSIVAIAPIENTNQP